MMFWNELLIGIRLLCLAVFLYTSICVNVSSIISLLLCIVSLYALHPQKHKLQVNVITSHSDGKNPLRGKPANISLEDLPKNISEQVAKEVSDFVMYDAEQSTSLDNFKAIQTQTECIFAKRAKLWGATDYDDTLNLEVNIDKSLPTFLMFCIVCQHLGLDGFVFDLPLEFGEDITTFGDTVRRVLTTIADKDPCAINCMKKASIDRKGWVFEFNRTTFFITTFAPCYPKTHPRYAFESEQCFILFQPEISFAQHDIPTDTVNTSWLHPKTVRDRIRIAFKDAGREYYIRNTTAYPMVHDIVRTIEKDVDYIPWWRKPAK